MTKRALLSVSDKIGLVEFAKELVTLDYEIVSTGGTYKTIVDAGIPAIYVSEVTNFPEILDGRVKTLHPNIHSGILAMRTPDHLSQLNKLGIKPIDIVAVNLYPFIETVRKAGCTFDLAIENIDIGGPSMVRAAAKNHKAVTIVVNPDKYPMIIDELKKNGEINAVIRRNLAYEAFTHTAAYDSAISTYLADHAEKSDELQDDIILANSKIMNLRYGENPHQRAAFYSGLKPAKGTIANSKQHQGKELSFNNIFDSEAAIRIVHEFTEPSCSIIKHNNPCGVASADNCVNAFMRAHEVDTVSAYGGIVAFNIKVDKATASEIVKTFFEVIIAPEFDADALEVFAAKKNLRVLSIGYPRKDDKDQFPYDIKKVGGGFLLQDQDLRSLTDEDFNLVVGEAVDEATIEEMKFAWKVVKHVKSNAIVITKDKQTIGVGAGQMNRVGSAAIALDQAGDKCKGAIMASDAFLPFADNVEVAAKHGIKAIIQTGGSIHDDDVIAAAKEHGIIMVTTGIRHFKH